MRKKFWAVIFIIIFGNFVVYGEEGPMTKCGGLEIEHAWQDHSFCWPEAVDDGFTGVNCFQCANCGLMYYDKPCEPERVYEYDEVRSN